FRFAFTLNGIQAITHLLRVRRCRCRAVLGHGRRDSSRFAASRRGGCCCCCCCCCRRPYSGGTRSAPPFSSHFVFNFALIIVRSSPVFIEEPDVFEHQILRPGLS
ncbi:unnamed protein product, partial [Ectocarpus sp. 12 AP-2014]